MKPLKYIAYGIFLIGMTFKFLHYPGPGTLMMLSILLQCIYVTISSIKKNKDSDKRVIDLYGITIMLVSTYLFSRVQFLPLMGISYLALLMGIIVIAFHFRNKKKVNTSLVVLFIFLDLVVISMLTPYSTMYYFINLNTTLNAKEREYYDVPWDRYSWQLYWEGKYTEALQANDSAQKAARFMLSNHIETDSSNLKYDQQHRIKIQNRTWTDYNP